MANAGVEATIFNFAVWSFSNLAAIAARFTNIPIMLFSNINPRYAGLVAMLATTSALDAIGDDHQRISGDIGQPHVLG